MSDRKELVEIWEFTNGGRYHITIGSITVMCDSIKASKYFIELYNDGRKSVSLLTEQYTFVYKFLRGNKRGCIA